MPSSSQLSQVLGLIRQQLPQLPWEARWEAETQCQTVTRGYRMDTGHPTALGHMELPTACRYSLQCEGKIKQNLLSYFTICYNLAPWDWFCGKLLRYTTKSHKFTFICNTLYCSLYLLSCLVNLQECYKATSIM